MAYLLDTNVLITAKNSHYGFDFCPGYWEWIVERHRAGMVYSVRQVRQEIERGRDELSEWVKRLPPGFFLDPNKTSRDSLAAVSEFINEPGRYGRAQVTVFAQAADYSLVGQSLQGGYTVVTYEAFQKAKGKIQIPEVCSALGIECLAPHEMLRRERARLVLGADA